jgi:transposase InsO family protein
MRTLHWQQPGSVWAIDFTEPALPVEGCFGQVLAVHDLASGYQLLWLATTDESELTVRDILQPQYNGSCEASIGSMKTRTHNQAARGRHVAE